MNQPLPIFPASEELNARLRSVLTEDLGSAGDVTSQAIFSPEHRSNAMIVSKASGILCGLPLLERIADLFDPSIAIKPLVDEGTRIQNGQRLVELSGSTISLLSLERTFLNFLQRLSGVATLTRQFVDAVEAASLSRKLKICDTRKTTPLWRDLQKYAVQVGGGANHRMGLYDMIMIKDTHADGAGGLKQALEKVNNANSVGSGKRYPVACETRSMEEVEIALAGNADLIMLDNMEMQTMREAITLIDGRAEVEITGMVTLDRIGELATIGADRVSIGALTHSAPILDLSMKTILPK